jgi:hypothetical protein
MRGKGLGWGLFALLSICGCSRTPLGDAATFEGSGATAGGGDGGNDRSGGNGGNAGNAGNGGNAGRAGATSGGRGGAGGGSAGQGGGAGKGGGGAGGSAGSAGSGGPAGSAGQGGSVGGAPTCGKDFDCRSNSSCAIARCIGGRCTTEPRDLDGDGAVDRACGGTDCNDSNPTAFPGGMEMCGDAADNDCNGVADCLDPACKGVPDCACVPIASSENCNNGIDDDCSGALDCNDPACIGTPGCGCDKGVPENCGNGMDDDCDGAVDCMDPDCREDDVCTCNKFEDCTNRIDDDCDGLVDCADPFCSLMPACTCTPPGKAENCNNARDDDCNGLVDCADPSCASSPFCMHCIPEVCNNGDDDDCDGAIDCADSNCRFGAGCAPIPEQCNNKVDDDRDTLTDCFDPDCAKNPACIASHSTCVSALLITASGSYTGSTVGFAGENEGTCGGAAPEAVFRLSLRQPTSVSLDTRGSNFDTALYVRLGSCGKGREIGCDDDDGNQGKSSALSLGTLPAGDYYIFVDGFTVDPVNGPDIGQYVLNVDLNGKPSESCDNRIDDDGDGYADCADPDCLATCKGCNNGKDPIPELGIAACTDGIDDDCDGAIDCADSDCSASPRYPTECCDGKDQNGNGIADDFACRCVTSADCPSNELCYDHFVRSCAPPCDNFNGDVCAFAVPGSSCNVASEQCEF